MFREYSSVLGIALVCLLGCSAAPDSQSDDDAGSSETGGQEDGGAAANSNGGSSQGGSNSGGTSSTTVVPSAKLTLSSATARVGGRFGDELIITVDGSGEVGWFASVGVVLRDASDAGVNVFDSNWDGERDSSSGRLVPLAAPGKESFSMTVSVTGIADYADELAEAEIRLFDREGGGTEGQAVEIAKQTLVLLGDTCDPELITSRCRQGFTCSADSETCIEGTAPVITTGAYQTDPDGPFMRLFGEDPDDDVIMIRMDFLASDNTPVSIDLDGDGVGDATSFEAEAGITNANGQFVFINQAGLTFLTDVPKIAMTAIDSRGNESATKNYSLGTPVVQATGTACSAYGLDTCEEDVMCVVNPETNVGTCKTATQVATNSCNAAATWDLASDPMLLFGVVESGNGIWEPPYDCMGETALGRPETVVKLQVPSGVTQVKLSTALPETSVDTALYVLSECKLDSTPLDCVDDTIGYATELTLSSPDEGDYYVIVESVLGESGGFGIQATVE